ncbi:MAG: methyltransferase domain-containing protein [Candidatus Sericytochromatia bacterium]
MENHDSVQSLEESLIKKLQETPTDFNLLNKLGYIYLHSNNLLKSEEVYLKSINIENDQFEPYVSLGLICTITNRLSRALYFLVKAQEKDKNSEDLVNSINEIKEAIVNKDSKITQEELDLAILHAKNYADSNNFEYAIYEYLRLECLNPNDESILNNIAINFFKNLDYNLAEFYFKKVLKINASNAISHHYLGIIYNILGDYKQAENSIYKSLELKPSFADFSGGGKYAHYRKEYEENEIENCPFCTENKSLIINIFNQSINSFNFNQINPVRIWNKCSNCDLVFSKNIPSEKSLERYFTELNLHTKKIFSFDIERHIFESNTSNERLNTIEKYIEAGKVLDISPNNDIFLSVAKNRMWKTETTSFNTLFDEKNETQILGLGKKKKVNNKKENKTYNLITYWDSLEKNNKVLATLNKIYNLLDKDGLFAFSFHGIDTYIAKSLDKNYPLWYYPDHFYFFEIPIIKKEIEKIGFKINKIQIISRKYLSNVEFYCSKK